MSQPKKILIVEDDANMRELVKARLEQNGYQVATAADGYQAIARAREFQPDLVILDLMIPKMDGYTVCRLLRASRSEPLPIIMFTARSSPDDVRRGLDMGANAYITKPFDPPVLLNKIRELLFPEESAQEHPEPAGTEPKPEN
ncbi:MAG: response regulator [candidate division WOR-3 bacterium]